MGLYVAVRYGEEAAALATAGYERQIGTFLSYPISSIQSMLSASLGLQWTTDWFLFQNSLPK